MGLAGPFPGGLGAASDHVLDQTTTRGSSRTFTAVVRATPDGNPLVACRVPNR